MCYHSGCPNSLLNGRVSYHLEFHQHLGLCPHFIPLAQVLKSIDPTCWRHLLCFLLETSRRERRASFPSCLYLTPNQLPEGPLHPTICAKSKLGTPSRLLLSCEPISLYFLVFGFLLKYNFIFSFPIFYGVFRISDSRETSLPVFPDLLDF